MNPEYKSQENMSISYGNAGTVTEDVNEYDSAPSCSFTSAKFDPIKALNTPNLCEDDIDTYDDLYALRSKAHSEALLVTSHEGVEGVDGPGGFPSEVVKPKITAERHFTADQGPMPGKPRKRLRNVLNRMEEVQGPFAALRKCRDTQTRVKVYTRSYNEVRGIMTGYVAAFDKHWNLVLRDVDEIFHKKIKCKTPVFDNVENFTKVADLSLREENDPEYRDPRTDKTSLIWQNPFSTKTNRGCKIQQTVTATSEEKQSSEVSSRLDSKDNDWEARRETRTTHGCLVDRAILRGSSSFSREARVLRLGRPTIWGDVRESSNLKSEVYDDGKGKPKKVSEKDESHLEEDSYKSEQWLNPPVSPKSKKYRKRKRPKIELRQRHVGQILIRGENVVLVNILEV